MRRAVLLLAALAFASGASAQDFRIEEMKSVTALDVDGIKPRPSRSRITVPTSSPILAAGSSGSRTGRANDRCRSSSSGLYPSYVEPTVTKTSLDGTSRLTKEKLHMYVAEARFVLAKAPDKVDLDPLCHAAGAARHRCGDHPQADRPNEVALLAPDVETANGLHPDRPVVRDQAERDLRGSPATSWKASFRSACG